MKSFCDSHSWVGWLLNLNGGSFKEPVETQLPEGPRPVVPYGYYHPNIRAV
jgi:hypothetical protein